MITHTGFVTYYESLMFYRRVTENGQETNSTLKAIPYTHNISKSWYTLWKNTDLMIL